MAELYYPFESINTMNGAETTEKALALEPGLKVITLSMFGDENYYSRMVQALSLIHIFFIVALEKLPIIRKFTKIKSEYSV